MATLKEIKQLQREMNRFVRIYVRGGREPIPVDGERGPRTHERRDDVQWWLGFNPEREVSAEDLIWAMRHPRRVKSGEDKDRPSRGKQRRKRHRKRHQTNLRKAARKRSDERFDGSRYFTNRVIDLADKHRKNVRVTSRKRPILLGNTGSDHNFFNRSADAVDHGLINDQSFMDLVAEDLAGHPTSDFAAFTVVNPRNGKRYRAQLIAVRHGTGDHHHSGFKRI